jgi:hypothetical protein
MMYGGKYFNFEVFSDVSDWTIRRDIRKEKLQKELYRKYVLKQ